MGALPTGVRAELGVGSLRPIWLAALRAQADARRHRHRPMRMKDRAGRVASVESVPCKVLLAAHGRPFDPAQAAYRHDVGTRRHEGRGLLGGGPVRFEQQPRRQDAREVPDQGVHEFARVGRVGDDRVNSRPNDRTKRSSASREPKALGQSVDLCPRRAPERQTIRQNKRGRPFGRPTLPSRDPAI